MITDFPESSYYSDEDYEMSSEDTASKEITTTESTTVGAGNDTSKTEDDRFLYYTMAAVGGLVALIITIVIIAFIIKSMRKRRHNLRVYRERQARPATVSLEIIDRDDHLTETINGVHNSLYSQDIIIPITVFDSEVHRDQTSSQQTDTVDTARTNGTHTKQKECGAGGGKQSERCAPLERESNASSSAQIETIASAYSDYENTKVSNHRLLSASDKPKQISMPDLNNERFSQKQPKTFSTYSDYETAFPIHDNKSSADCEKVDERDGNVKNGKNRHISESDKEITTKENDVFIIKEEKAADKRVSESKQEKPEVKLKPKPAARKLADSSGSTSIVTKNDNEDDSHDYENSLTKQENCKVNKALFMKEANDADTTDDSHDYENSLEKQENCKVNKALFIKGANDVDTTDDSHDYENSLAKQEQCNVNKVHIIKEDIITDKKVSKLRKPKIQPRPTVAKEPIKNDAERNVYDNSSAKVKGIKFQQAKLLKTVPPACNTNTYVNVQGSKSNVSPLKMLGGQLKECTSLPKKKSIDNVSDKSGRESSAYVNVPKILSDGPATADSLKRQSSEYEDSESVLILKKHSQYQSEVEDGVSKEKQIKYKKYDDLKGFEENVMKTGSKPNHGVSKSKLPVPKIKKQFGLENKQTKIKTATSESKAKQGVLKCDYANIDVRGHPRSKDEDGKDFDYENEDKVNELKSTLKRLGKRGFSTSSLETCRQEKMLTQKHRKPVPGTCTMLDDDLYLKMDAGDNVDDNVYLDMDAVNDGTYMEMVTPEDDEVYMPMENNYSYPKLSVSKTQIHYKKEDIGTARSYQTCPKPCSGVRSGAYVNFSEQSSRYVNFFRSKSTDNVYSYVGKRPDLKFPE